jgi:hypothetical protein
MNVAQAMHQIISMHPFDGVLLAIRAGMNCGPAVSGIIGKNKFCFDLWGDAVNVASRMETTGIPKGTHVTREVYQLLKDTVDFTPCGLTFVKGKGELETYLHMSTPAPMGRLTHNVSCLTSNTVSESGLPEGLNDVIETFRDSASRHGRASSLTGQLPFSTTLRPPRRSSRNPSIRSSTSQRARQSVSNSTAATPTVPTSPEVPKGQLTTATSSAPDPTGPIKESPVLDVRDFTRSFTLATERSEGSDGHSPVGTRQSTHILMLPESCNGDDDETANGNGNDCGNNDVRAGNSMGSRGSNVQSAMSSNGMDARASTGLPRGPESYGVDGSNSLSSLRNALSDLLRRPWHGSVAPRCQSFAV